jgi:endonuclease/exonuclease/phosphatase (EEP) superfamily protein YafD
MPVPSPDPKDARRSRRPRLHLVLAPFAAGAAGATLLGFAGRVHWLVDLWSHFRVQYLVALLVFALACALLRQWRWAAACPAFAAVNAATMLPYLRPTAGDAGDGGERLRVVAMNVLTSNTRGDLVVAYLRAERPDVVVIAEVDDAWAARLAPVMAAYPCAHVTPRGDNFGIAVLARRPCVARDLPLGGDRLPTYEIRIAAGRDSVTVVGTHPLPPRSGAYAASRDRQLAALGEHLARTPGTKLLVGDLNATPWSAPFRALVRRTGMRDASDGGAIHATWPASGGHALMRIPIDHVLASPDVAVDDVRLGPDVGSDHLPLAVDLRVP